MMGRGNGTNPPACYAVSISQVNPSPKNWFMDSNYFLEDGTGEGNANSIVRYVFECRV